MFSILSKDQMEATESTAPGAAASSGDHGKGLCGAGWRWCRRTGLLSQRTEQFI